MAITAEELTEAIDKEMIKRLCEADHLFFARAFFFYRQNMKFRVNWHHRYIADIVQDVIDGKKKRVVINVSPGSSKTEMVIINFIARGLAMNPMSRFLHLSYSDDLALLNSQTARDLILSDEFQAYWPLKISEDTKSKKRWNVMVKGKKGGGVYATSLSGQITGFRAGHMEPGFQGCVLIDDPIKPEDAFSKPKMAAASRKLISTVQSRLANPDTPIVMIMQRVAEDDPTGFIKQGNMGDDWHHVVIPAVIDEEYVSNLPTKYQSQVERDGVGKFSYWPYKEPIANLMKMESGQGENQTGSRISRMVFASQYQQNPVALGGNLIKTAHFIRYRMAPKILYRNIYADTALKTDEQHDYSVFECWGMGSDGKIYLLDLMRGKYESPDLRRRAVDFWNKHRALTSLDLGQLRRMNVEEKASGFDIIQSLKQQSSIPIFAIERHKDKLTRLNDALPYIESGRVAIPEDAPFVHDFLAECEAFTGDFSHKHDDQIDPLMDAIMDLLSSQNRLAVWAKQ